MRRKTSLIVLTLGLCLGGFVNVAAPGPASGPAVSVPLPGGWIVDKKDFLCGIADARKISNPAKVDYEKCLEATEPMKELKRKKLDPESAEGKALRNRARTLVTRATELVRRAKGHCGVWKVIRHSDGRIVPDVTKDVKEKL